MIDKLQPISGNHSIYKVIANIFVPQLFYGIQELLSTIQEDTNLTHYQSKIQLQHQAISFIENQIQVAKEQPTGIALEEFDSKGIVKNILKVENQIANNSNSSVVSLENRIYEDWNRFKKRLIEDITYLSDIYDFPVEAISLTYVDEFKWEGDEEIPVRQIFKENSDLLSKKLLDSTDGALVLLSQKIVDGLNHNERTNISFSNINKRITINHQYVVKTSDIKKFSTLKDEGVLLNYLDVAHTQNKEMLKDILTKECQELIKLK